MNKVDPHTRTGTLPNLVIDFVVLVAIDRKEGTDKSCAIEEITPNK
jgi:hypothetical protein